MKRYVSVFEMIARSSIYKVLLIILGMVAIQAASFYLTWTNENAVTIEKYIEWSNYDSIFKIAYLLITVVIVLPGMNRGSVQSYTLQRLRIKESQIFLLQALYNLLAYVLLWGFQLFAILMTGFVYQKNLPMGAVWNNQSLFLAFYRNDFMHTILPLEDIPGWCVLVLVGLSSAIVTAEFTKRQRMGKVGVELIIWIAAVMSVIPRGLGDNVGFFVAALAVLYLMLGTRWVSNKLGGE